MLENITNSKIIAEHLETIGECYLSIAKELSKEFFKTVQTKTRGKTDSYANKKIIKKKGVNDKLQKGSVSYRPNENRYMYRYRDKMQNNKTICGYAKTKKEAQSLLKKELADYYDRLSYYNKTGITNVIPIIRTITQTNANANGNGNGNNISLNDFFTYWVDTFKKQELKESTYLSYKEIYNRYANNSIGKKSVGGITASDLQEFINDVPSYTAKKKLMQYFKDMFNLLHKQNYITTNPMAFVVLPKKNTNDTPLENLDDKNIKKEILSYKREKLLLAALSRKPQKNKHFNAVKFILYSGVRRGELLGLQRKHIDFENETIIISQQFNYKTKKISDVKTVTANRIIPMLPEAKEALIDLISKKNLLSGEDFLFNDCDQISQRLSYEYTKFLGFNISPHILRHTFASRCYAAGLDTIKIRDLLGHRSIDTTLEVYTHTLQAEDKDVIQKMRDFFVSKGMIIKLY